MHYLILGGGIAGTTAAETLRKLDASADISVLSDEPHPIYSRVLLPKYILGTIPRERVFLKSPEWYEQQNIHLAFHTVEALDAQRKRVTIKGGHTISYDKLLIASGGHAKRLPFDRDKSVYHFQTVDDADAIVSLLQKLDGIDGPTTGIVGGGFIAMEFVDLFAAHHCRTHIFIRNDRYFTPTFDLDMSRRLTDHLAEQGVTTHLQTEIASWDDSLARTVAGGALPLHALAAGVGLFTRFEWIAGAGVAVNHGIVANEFLETNLPDVYTAGDCTEFYDVIVGRALHQGNWMNAQMQGRHVAAVMTGDRKPFRLVSSYSTHVLGAHIVAVGDARRDHAQEIVVRDDGEGRTLLMLFDGKLMGASIWRRTDDRAGTTKLVEAQTDLSRRHAELADPTVPLLSLL